jgi:SAM-dependent methyltransferase
MKTTDYRYSHTAPGAGQRYDALFAEDRYDGWIWEKEQEVLRGIVRAYATPGHFRLLDFACGTGRVLQFLEPLAREAVGVDVSSEMLRLAAGNVRQARLINADITRDRALLGDQFDLITAFRFFLNANDGLRRDALTALRDMLRDGGVLVANIHVNLWSLKLPSHLFRRWVRRQSINATSIRSMTHLFHDHGFRVIRVIGVGWCSPRIFTLVGKRWASRIEELLERVPILTRCATDVIYVCTKQ